MLPTARLVEAVQAFEAKFPTVTFSCTSRRSGRLPKLVMSGIAGIGIGGTLHTTMTGIEQLQAGDVEMIPVAAPHHPLARNQPKLQGEALSRQLILTVRSSFTEGQDPVGALAPTRGAWRILAPSPCPAARRQRMGLHARAGRPRRPSLGATGTARSSRRARRFLRAPGNLSCRQSARSSAAWLIRHFVSRAACEEPCRCRPRELARIDVSVNGCPVPAISNRQPNQPASRYRLGR